MLKTFAITLALLFASQAAPAVATAVEIEDVEFDDVFDHDGTRLPVRGVGLLRYRVLFRGYVGALYLPSDVPPERVFEDVPKRLELSYFWSIGKELFGEAGEEVLQKNVDAAVYQSLRPRLAQLGAAYRDVAPSDRYALTYRPGIGTELALNGRSLIVIPGADFAAAYFRIWLGDSPIDKGFRDALLGRAD